MRTNFQRLKTHRNSRCKPRRRRITPNTPNNIHKFHLLDQRRYHCRRTLCRRIYSVDRNDWRAGDYCSAPCTNPASFPAISGSHCHRLCLRVCVFVLFACAWGYVYVPVYVVHISEMRWETIWPDGVHQWSNLSAHTHSEKPVASPPQR